MATLNGRRAFLKKTICLLSTQVIYGCGGGSGGNPDAAEPDTIASVAPGITAQPLDQSVLTGEIATFDVLVTGTQPFSFQWQRNGVDIIGATNRSYTTPVTGSENGAVFSVVVTNSAGSIKSRDAILTVVQLPVTVDSTFITIDSTLYSADST